MISNTFPSLVVKLVQKEMVNNATFRKILLLSSDNIDNATSICKTYADKDGNKTVEKC